MSTPTNQGDKNFPPDSIQTEPANNPAATQKTPFWKRSYTLTTLVLGGALAAALAVGAAVGSPIAYHAGRNSEVTNIVLDQARDKSEEYTSVNRKLADAEHDLRNAQKRQLELEDANEEAEATIEKAKSYKIDDLKAESEQLKKEYRRTEEDARGIDRQGRDREEEHDRRWCVAGRQGYRCRHLPRHTGGWQPLLLVHFKPCH